MSGKKLAKSLQRLTWSALRSAQAGRNATASSQLVEFSSGAPFRSIILLSSRWKPDFPTNAGCRQHRSINVDVHGQEGEELSEKDYHRIADLTLGEVMVKLESLIEETPGIADSDLEYSQGVLTLNLGSHGTYVINKQGPNKQIWMSSPISGPVRYDLVNGRWIYRHDGHVFQERLAEELQQMTGQEKIDLDQEPQVSKGYVGYGADPT